MDLTNDFLSEIVEVLFGIHEFLQVDHRVEVSDDKKLVLAACNIHINLVHRDVFRVASVGILLHLGVIFLHSIGFDTERERSSLFDVVEEIPGCRGVGIFFLSEALHLCGLKHVVEFVVVRIFGTLVVVHLEHA